MEVLVYLAEHAGELVSKEQLLEVVWQGAAVEDGALARCMSELRATLGDDVLDKLLETKLEEYDGYRLHVSHREFDESINL